MTYPPGAERAIEAPPVPEATSTPTEKAFRQDVERSVSPAATLTRETDENSLDNPLRLRLTDGPKLNFSPTVQSDKSDGTIKTLDEAGNLKTVEFPGQPGKKHSYGYNDRNELNSVDRKDNSTGEDISLKREAGTKTWYVENDGTRLYLPGKVEVRNNGDFAVEQKDGTWRVQDTRGNLVQERRLESGASVQLNKNESISKVNRTDGSDVSCQYNEKNELIGITETRAGKSSSWTRNENGEFTQKGSDEVRKDLTVGPDGVLKYKTADGCNHVVGGDGSHTVSVGDSKTASVYDSAGRLTDYKKADGSSRHFDYEGDTDKISKFTELNANGEVVKTFDRTGENEWKCMQGSKSLGTWHGDLKTGADGSWRMLSQEKGQNPEGLWRNVDNQENTTYLKINKDGSKLTFDSDKKFTEMERADGSGVIWTTHNGSPRISTLMPDGSKLHFDYDMQAKVWKCNSPDVKDSPEMPIKGNGEFIFKTVDGSTKTVKTDSTMTVSKRDGTALNFDAHSNLTSISRAGKERIIERDGDKVTGFTERAKDKPDRHVDLSTDRSVRITANGDIIHTTADGKRQIETSDFSHVDCNDAGKPVKVTAANGAVRDIEWNPATNQPVSITDTVKVGDKEVSRKWETGPDWQGTFAVINEKDGKLTQRFARHDVQIDDVGNYKYLTQSGDKVLSKPGDGARVTETGFVSANIDEAHYNFLENMRMSLNDENRTERLESMMTGFETRMANTIERRVAGGEAEDKVREEVEKKVTETYDHLSKLATSDSKTAVDDKATRVMLAETFMYHAWEPETVTQQGWGSCWLQSGYIPCGLGENPHDMARVLTDVSLTGSFTDKTNRTYNFNPADLGIRNARDGAGWSIAKAPSISEPSPVAHRLDRTMSVMDGGSSRRISTGGGGQREILNRVCGEKMLYVGGYPNSPRERLAMLRSGGAQRDGGPNHVATWAMRKEGNHWLLVRGNQYNDDRRGDRVVAIIRDLKSWVQNGEAASINKRFGPNFIGRDFKVVSDEVKPTDFRPNNRPGDRFRDPDNDNVERPIIAWFRRRRRRG